MCVRTIPQQRPLLGNIAESDGSQVRSAHARTASERHTHIWEVEAGNKHSPTPLGVLRSRHKAKCLDDTAQTAFSEAGGEPGTPCGNCTSKMLPSCSKLVMEMQKDEIHGSVQGWELWACLFYGKEKNRGLLGSTKTSAPVLICGGFANVGLRLARCSGGIMRTPRY